MAGRNAIIRVSVLGDSKGFHKTISDVESRFGKLGGKLDSIGQKAGKVLAGGLALAGAAAVRAGQKAGDFGETVSKATQIFGDEAIPALQKFASGAAKSMGQSKQSAMDAAATFGIFGKSAGLAGKDLVGFSTEMTTLSSDMASFSNTSPEEAIEAIGAALRGESEPIRKYGVLLDDATLKQRAMTLGIYEGTGALTPQQKVLAAHAEILAQTKDQQGDFARTSDSLANKQRVLKAQFENLQISIGEKVLPVLVKLSEIGLKALNWVDQNRTLVGVLIVVLGGLTAAVWAISAAMRAWIAIQQALKVVMIVVRNAQLALNLVMMANPIGLVIAAIVALVAIFVIAYKKSETFRNIVNKSWQAIKAVSAAVFGWLKSFIMAIFNGIKAFFVTIFTAYRTLFTALWDWLKTVSTKAWTAFVTLVRDKLNSFMDLIRGLKDRVVGALGKIGDWLYNAGKDLIQGLINGIKNMASNVVDAAKGVVSGAINAAKNLLQIGSPSKLFRKFGEWTGEGLVMGLRQMGGAVKYAGTGLAKKVAEGFEAPELKLPARPELAGNVNPTQRPTTVNINVSVPPTANPAETGRVVVAAVKDYYRQGGERL